MKTKTLLGALTVAATAAFATAAQAEGTVVWSMQGDALTLDPMSQNEGPTNAVARQIYETLVGRNVEMTIDPQLATEWRTIDPETWEFTLRQGVTFHDGAAFTAEDVVFSFERAKHEASDFKSYIGTVTGVEAVDDYTVRITTDGPNPILLSQISNIFIMDKDWAEANGSANPQNYAAQEETFAVRNANGTGPFSVELREQDVRTVFQKNPNWWGADQYPVNIDAIELRPINNAATRVAALLSGEIDVVTAVPLQDIGRVSATPNLKLEQINQIRTIFFGMDIGADSLRHTDGPNPFADPKVREAMYRAIDIEAIRQKVMRDLAFPAGIITSPGVDGYTPELDERLAFDVEGAKALMAQSGFPDGFSAQLDCPNDRYNNDEAICQATVGMLAQIGIDVTLNAQSKSLHFPLIQNRETDFYMLGWGVPTLDSHYVFDFLYKSDGTWNATGFADARLDELVAAMAREVDLEKRNAMIQEAWEIAKASNAYLPLHHQVIVWASKDTVTLPIRPNDEPLFRHATVN